MLEWIIGALGVGGIAAAIAFVPGAKAIALQFIDFVAALFRRHPVECLLVIAVACGVWQFQRAENWKASAREWTAHAKLEASNHRQTKANYRRAQIAAHASAVADRIRREEKSAAIAREIEHANDEIDYWRSAARRYADAGGMREHESRAGAGSASGRPAAAGKAGAAAIDDRSGPAPVVLSRGDFDLCFGADGYFERTLRNKALADRWIAEGWAAAARDEQRGC